MSSDSGPFGYRIRRPTFRLTAAPPTRTGPELVADLLHRRQQHVVERRDRADLVVAAVDPLLDAFLLAPQDVEVQRGLGLHPGGRVGLLLLLRRSLGLEVLDQPLQRIL